MRFRYLLAPALALALAGSTAAQTGSGASQPGGVGPSSSLLYRNEPVARSLRLTENQVGQLDRLTDQLQTRFRDDFKRVGDLRPEIRATRLSELDQRYNRDWMTGARDVLNEDQLIRYRQLGYQSGGFSAFADPDVQKQLSLTDEQRRALNDHIDWSREQLSNVYRSGSADRERGLRMYNDYQKDYDARLGKYLTPEQRKIWGEMTGERFEFVPTFPPAQPRR